MSGPLKDRICSSSSVEFYPYCVSGLAGCCDCVEEIISIIGVIETFLGCLHLGLARLLQGPDNVARLGDKIPASSGSCELSGPFFFVTAPMALKFLPSRSTGFALAAGCLMFSALAAASVRPEDLSVSQIEEQLQVWKSPSLISS